MMTAERWYEHQDNYKRYGLDMKPRPVKQEKIIAKPSITARDKFTLVFLVAIIGILCIGVIISTAYAAKVKYETNVAIKKNSDLLGEIENLNVKIKSQTNIETIEWKALNELGMICPSGDQVIYIVNDVPPSGDFAMLLKEQAYN